MWLSENLKSFLDISNSLGGNRIYLTDTYDVLYVGNCTSLDEVNKPISKDILRKLLSLNIEDISNLSFLTNNKKDIIPIYEDPNLNINWNSQIILPVYADDTIFGALIFTNYNKNLCDVHLDFAKTTQYFVNKFILKYLSENSEIEDDNEIEIAKG